MSLRIFGLAASMALSFAVSANAQDDPGRHSYMQYCASCHGGDAKGDGPLSTLLTVKAPDLTTLAASNDGQFPMLNVIHIIDGRTGLRGHGGAMPVYGALFDSRAEGTGTYAAPLETRGLILSLAYYLEALQGE